MLDLIKAYHGQWVVSFVRSSLWQLRDELCADIGLKRDSCIIALFGELCFANILWDLQWDNCDICGEFDHHPGWTEHPYWGADEGYSRCIDCFYAEQSGLVYSTEKKLLVEWNEFYVIDVLKSLVVEEHPMISDDIMKVILNYAEKVDIDQILGFMDGYYIVHRILEPFGIKNGIPAAIMNQIIEYGAFMDQNETVLWQNGL